MSINNINEKQKNLEHQREFLSLLMKYKPLVENWAASPLKQEYFDEEFQFIIKCILYAYENDSILTRKYFTKLRDTHISNPQERVKQEGIYNNIKITECNEEDYAVLIETLVDEFLTRKSAEEINHFIELKNKKGIKYALKQVTEQFKNLSLDTDGMQPIKYVQDYEYGQVFLEEIKHAKEQDVIKCHIPEIDQMVPTGFAPGMLSLLCADVGGFKTTMMMNLGLNIWRYSNKNVLFVPIEMPIKPYFQKLLSRETGIAFSKLERRDLLTDEEWEKANKEINSWENRDSRFYVMESLQEQVKVSTIEKEIKRNIDLFKPNIVIIDYIANLMPDLNREGRHDKEIGEMLKYLYHIGRPGVIHEEGFHVISAAQLGRKALTRLRKDKDDVAFNSEDLRDSHEYSMYASYIFAQWPDENMPDERLWITPIKARWGAKTYSSGSRKAALEVNPTIGFIQSLDYNFENISSDDVLLKASAVEVDDIEVKIKGDSIDTENGDFAKEEENNNVNINDEVPDNDSDFDWIET